MSGVLRLGNTGAGTGRSTVQASASNDQTFLLPEAGGTLLTSNYSVPGGTITFNGSDINITNGDLNVDSGTLFVDESSNRVGIGTTSPTNPLHLVGNALVDGNLTFTPAKELIFGTTSNPAPRLTNSQAENDLSIFTNNLERVRLTQSGRILVDTPTARSNLFAATWTPRIQIESDTDQNTSASFIVNGGGNRQAGLICLGSSSSNTPGGNGIVADTQGLGILSFQGGTGTTMFEAARFQAIVDGTPTSGGVPGALRFSTCPGTGTTQARLTIDSEGLVLVGLSTARTNFYGSLPANLQIQGTTFSACSVYATNGNGAYILGRSNATDGSSIGNISWQINDGTTMVPGANINCIVDGTPGLGDCPSRLEFSTRADGATSQTQRMYIWSGGDITVGTASRAWFGQTQQFGVRAISATGCAILALQDTGGEYPYEAWNSGASGIRGLIKFRVSGAGSVVGAITTDGSTTTYSPTSDYRAKENIIPLTNAIQRFKKLKPYNYNFITTPDIPRDGFLAHEVEDIIPDAVVGKKDAVDEKGEPIYQGLDLTRIVPLLSAALQETLTKVEALEAEVSKLRSK